MRNYASQILKDGFGLTRACGLGVGLRFFWLVAMHFRDCLRSHSLNPVGLAMGPGPFRCRLRSASAMLCGNDIISSIREIWVRDVYTANGFLSIQSDAVVVDLGANRGVFTALALGHGPGVRVVAVEVDPTHNQNRREILALNGWDDRVTIVPAFIGPASVMTDELIGQIRASGHPATSMSEADLIQVAGLTHIDFLKCDIEGSEFGLLHADSELLRLTSQLAIELHTNVGDANQFEVMLHQIGFETKVVHVIGETVLLTARRGKSTGTP